MTLYAAVMSHTLALGPTDVLGDLQSSKVKEGILAGCDEEVRTTIAVSVRLPLHSGTHC